MIFQYIHISFLVIFITIISVWINFYSAHSRIVFSLPMCSSPYIFHIHFRFYSFCNLLLFYFN